MGFQPDLCESLSRFSRIRGELTAQMLVVMLARDGLRLAAFVRVPISFSLIQAADPIALHVII